MSLSELQRIKREHLAALEARERDALARMVDSYAEIVNGLQSRVEAAWLDIERKRAAGEEVTASALFQQARIRSLLAQAEREFVDWSTASAAETESLRMSAVRVAGDAVRSELSYLTTPPSQSGSVVGAFDILPVDAIAQLLATLTPGAPVANLFASLPANISTEMRKALVVGLAAGENPRAVGRRMVKASAGGLANGVRIARTEMMRAYRAAHHENYRRNSNVVKGWIWLSARNARTCAGCLAMHGTFHTLDEELDDHPNGRCTPLPVTKSWAELGYGDRGWAETSIGENGVESGESWFARQSAGVWEQVLGKSGAAAYADGKVRLADFAGIKRDDTWGDSIYQRSLADAMKSAEARKQSEKKHPAHAPVAPATQGRTTLGTPVSVALDPEGEVTSLVNEVAAAIDSVHGDGVLPKLPLRFAWSFLRELDDGVAGAYRRTSDGTPHSILLSRAFESKRITLAHELGHFLDHVGIGRGGNIFGSEESNVLATWRREVLGSKTVQTIKMHRANMMLYDYTTIATPQGEKGVRFSRSFLDYLVSEKELFARSYAQYIAIRSGNADLMAELRYDQTYVDPAHGVYFSTQWADDEFEPIAKALDDAFRELQWMN